MQYYPLDIGPYFNNDGISFETGVGNGDFDGLGNTYPAEKLPASNQLVNLCGTPILFPDKQDDAFNNIILESQQIIVPVGNYCTLAIIGASDSGRYVGGGYEEPLILSYWENTKEKVKLRLKDWICIEEQRIGGKEALRCPYMHCPEGRCAVSERGYETYPTLWYEEISVDDSKTLDHIKLPDNPCMHIFAMTLEPIRKLSQPVDNSDLVEGL